MQGPENLKFPLIVSKGDLLVMYDLTYYTLKKFLGEDLMTELDWKKKRIFSPEETRKIFMRLSPTSYKEHLEQKLGRVA